MARPSGIAVNSALIVQLRQKLGLTQEALARWAGISTRVVQSVESKGTADISTIKRIADVLEVTREQLEMTGRIITVSGDFSKLTPEEAKAFLVDLQTKLGLGTLTLMAADHSSIRYTVRMSLADALKLDSAFKNQKLMPNVREVEICDDDELFKAEEDLPEVVDSQQFRLIRDKLLERIRLIEMRIRDQDALEAKQFNYDPRVRLRPPEDD